MAMTHTRTFVIMKVSKRTFEEIQKKLIEADYNHSLLKQEDGSYWLDMHGIALAGETKENG